MTDDSTTTLSLDEVRELARSVLVASGMDERGSAVLADLVQMSERDGPRSHGLRMLPVYAQSFSSGYANPVSSPRVERTAPGVLRGDGDNGYYQIVAAKAREELIEMARENGIAAFTCSNCHHLGALRFDTGPLAEAGLVALGVVNSLSMVVPQGGVRPVFGTNPMSFACPRPGGEPVVWDQASSMVALMDIRLAAAEGHDLPRPAGLDPDGQPTQDPNAILESRSLLPFGEHKGAAIAFLIEVLGAALAGGTLSVDNANREAYGALNIKGGHTLIAIDPARFGNETFGVYVQRICAEIEGNGDARVPGDGRLKNRAAVKADGVRVTADLMAQLRELQ
ncbi:delta1-piperideine-2-carboxylate reductase [Ruegeria halocynthiae]|uniref:Delta1-piperideine-2-carboxylate reductase n=1 Tax=Ruegeria halocynthiae TaxID=985054 RepID=A0A1H2XVJ5_9RHOB|nr:Ldh family oxidoreductase [Ruegeria halocynthiae]SDW96464.1 delta1-piperideine-2-carboxylate reductase [Ruegeria halocynthiae]